MPIRRLNAAQIRTALVPSKYTTFNILLRQAAGDAAVATILANFRAYYGDSTIGPHHLVVVEKSVEEAMTPEQTEMAIDAQQNGDIMVAGDSPLWFSPKCDDFDGLTAVVMFSSPSGPTCVSLRYVSGGIF